MQLSCFLQWVLLFLLSRQAIIVTKLEIVITILCPIYVFKEKCVKFFGTVKYNRFFSVLTKREDVEF